MITLTVRHKTERMVSDSWITTKVKSESLANSGTKAFKVSVKTRHKNVTWKAQGYHSLLWFCYGATIIPSSPWRTEQKFVTDP